MKGLDLSKSRVFLELEGVTPEEAARITINGGRGHDWPVNAIRLLSQIRLEF
jgi:hypothetical protein